MTKYDEDRVPAPSDAGKPQPCPACMEDGRPVMCSTLDDPELHQVECVECGTRGPLAETKHGAIAQWNMLSMGSPSARDYAAYLLDRADQYSVESCCGVALGYMARSVAKGEAQGAKEHGELDGDLYARVDRIAL